MIGAHALGRRSGHQVQLIPSQTTGKTELIDVWTESAISIAHTNRLPFWWDNVGEIPGSHKLASSQCYS